MSLIHAQNLTFSYPDKVILSGISFKIEPLDRVGLIGANGTGKTTLFKIIIGELAPTEGALVKGRDLKLGIMEQYLSRDDTITVYEDALTVFSDVEMMESELHSVQKSLEGETENYELIERQLFLTEELERRDWLVYKAKTRSALLGLGFTDSDITLKLSALSGGQRSKLALCKLLLSDCSLILLDEPTNHLDIDSVIWLEDFLSKYRGAAMIISHDRFFLDRVTTKTLELTNLRLYASDYSYSGHKKLMAERQLFIEKEYEKVTKEIARIEGIIEQQRRFNQERNYVTIASKQKQIDRLKADLVIPDKELRSARFSFNIAYESGNEVLFVKGLAKSFGEKKLFSDADLEIRKGERVFLLGPNGCGKSTLLKILTRELSPDAGSIKLGTGVKIGYFDQNISKLDDKATVLDEVWTPNRRLDATGIRKALAMFLFSGDEVYKTVGSLSGGERARIALLKLMLSHPNLLLLDEPTNHLDITSREVLEDALLDYDGTILAVSHDRYLINRLATSIAYLTKDGISVIDGNYDDYLVAKQSVQSVSPAKQTKPNEYKLRKERESEERRRIGKISRLENEIETIELQVQELQNELSLPGTVSDYVKTSELLKELDEVRVLLDEKYSEWETLSAQ